MNRCYRILIALFFALALDVTVVSATPEEVALQARGAAETNLQVAMPLLEKAVAETNPFAKIELAIILLTGRIDPHHFQVKPNPGRAIELLQQAVDANAAPAFFELASLYAAGVGEPRHDRETPALLFARAAHNGNPDAMMEMARRSRLGFGVDKDLLSAATWAARSHRGNAALPTDQWIGSANDSETQLLRQIFKLYEEGLQNFSAKALLELAEMNITGRHSQPNLPRAAALYTLAERNGATTAAAKRRDLESKLTAEDLEQLKVELKWMSASGLR